jgi:hypothetical protein
MFDATRSVTWSLLAAYPLLLPPLLWCRCNQGYTYSREQSRLHWKYY